MAVLANNTRFVLSAPIGTAPKGATGQLSHIDSYHVALTFDKHPHEELVLDLYDTDPEVWAAIAPATAPRVKLSRYGMAAGVAATVAVALLVGQGTLLASPPPPVVYKDWSMVHDTIKVGDPVSFTTHTDRNRVCQTSFDRAVISVSEGATVYSGRFYGAKTPPTVGFATRVVSSEIQPPLKPGRYLVTGSTHSECAKGGVYDTPHPPLSFTVVE